jgi:hypothetical protein
VVVYIGRGIVKVAREEALHERLVQKLVCPSCGKISDCSLFGNPQEVRALLREYLTKDALCKVTIRADLCGLKVSYINATNGTRINVRTLLSALKRLPDGLLPEGRWLLR